MPTKFAPIANELASIRERSAELARTLGYKAVAQDIERGGPLEKNLRFIRETLEGRKRLFDIKTRQQILTRETITHGARVQRIQDGLSLIIERIRELGGT